MGALAGGEGEGGGGGVSLLKAVVKGGGEALGYMRW